MDFVRAKSLNGKQIVRIPVRMSGKLAYLIAVVIGDGYLSKPIRRKSHGSGFHWKLVITGPRGYIINLQSMFFEMFEIRGGLIQDKRKRDAWQIRFSNLVLHRFFARVIGLPQGKKTVHGAWSRLDLVKEFPLHFLAGLIDSDGHIGSRYIGIIQKRFRFLVRVKRFARETTGLHFRGPYVNKRRAGEITSWIISISRSDERAELLRGKDQLDIGILT